MFWHMARSGASRTRHAALLLLVVAAAASLVGGLSITPGADADGNSNPLGVYAGALSPGTASSFGRAIGQQPTFAMDFLDGSSWSSLVGDAPTYMSTWSGSGYTMVWGVPMLPNSFSPDSNPGDTSGSAYGLEQGASGAYNSYFLKLAKEMVAGGQGSSIVRPGWEFNGSWFPWAANGQAAAFVGYWQQIVDTMRSVSGQNFTFEWNPTAGDQGVGDLATFYPGNAYVDYIGLDLYDQAWANYTGIASEWNTYLTEPYGLNWLASFAASQGKPITLPEWGLDPSPSSNDGGPVSQPGTEVGGGDDPTFINDMAQWIQQNHVFDATYWDYNSSRLSQSSNPNSDAAFVSDFGAGSSGPPPTTTTTTTATTTTTTTTTTTVPTTTTTTTGGSGAIASSLHIKRTPAPVVTSKPAEFSAVVRIKRSGAVGPAAPVSWTVKSAWGTPVPCRSSNANGDTVNGVARCTVPSGKIAAAAGPYTVSAHYAGSHGVAPSGATTVQHVAKANSLTNVRVTSKLLSGKRVAIVALVKGRPTKSSMPTGTVRFAVWSRTGQPVPCHSGGKATLQSGAAICIFGGRSSVPAPYFMKVTYSGDDNFAASTSKMQAVTVNRRAVSFLP